MELRANLLEKATLDNQEHSEQRLLFKVSDETSISFLTHDKTLRFPEKINTIFKITIEEIKDNDEYVQ